MTESTNPTTIDDNIAIKEAPKNKISWQIVAAIATAAALFFAGFAAGGGTNHERTLQAEAVIVHHVFQQGPPAAFNAPQFPPPPVFEVPPAAFQMPMSLPPMPSQGFSGPSTTDFDPYMTGPSYGTEFDRFVPRWMN